MFAFPPQPPATVYLVIPAEQLAAGAALARLWIGTFLRRAAKAQEKPSVPLLFLLDHCAALGSLPVLESLHTMTTAGALRIWTFWDDVHQLRVTYPRGWPAMLAGCGTIQVFGTSDAEAAAEAAAVLGLPADDVRSLGPADQIVRLDGVPTRVRRLGERDMTSRAQ
jgi:type IV secretion system protein VirD4